MATISKLIDDILDEAMNTFLAGMAKDVVFNELSEVLVFEAEGYYFDFLEVQGTIYLTMRGRNFQKEVHECYYNAIKEEIQKVINGTYGE